MSKEVKNNLLEDVLDNQGCIESVGGEALIEGVMMRGPENIAMAVRKSDGTIVVEKRPYKALSKRNKLAGLPIIRGMIGFVESMVIGVKALMFSAMLVELEEQDALNDDGDKDNANSDMFKNSVIYFSVFLAMIFGVALFILLPNFIAGLIKLPGDGYKNAVAYNFIEGFVRITIFICYIALVSKMKDIQRVFQYHGAEHKTIHCYEKGQDLTAENVKKYTRLHPRCGTSFMLQVMIISVLVFSFLGWPNLLMRLASRLVLVPIVAGISYEMIKWGSKSKLKIVRIINLPGLWLQKFTTREPDESQIEVAITALKNSIYIN